MFKSKEVDGCGKVLVPAAMDYLDPIREHRFFCPWKNPQAQNRSGTTGEDASVTAWVSLLQMLMNESNLRSIYEGRVKTTKPVPEPAVVDKESTDPSTPQRPTSIVQEPRSNPVVKLPALEFNETDRDAKDKERWARLRKVKSLFDTKSSRKLKRPGTPQSTTAITPQK